MTRLGATRSYSSNFHTQLRTHTDILISMLLFRDLLPVTCKKSRGCALMTSSLKVGGRGGMSNEDEKGGDGG